MWRLMDCFRSGDSQPARSRPTGASPPSSREALYQAPVVTPPLHAASVSSCDEDQDYEGGTLLPKRTTPEPMGVGPASSSQAPSAGPSSGSQDLISHRRQGSAGSSGWGGGSGMPGGATHKRSGSSGSGSHRRGRGTGSGSGGSGMLPLFPNSRGIIPALGGPGSEDTAAAGLLASEESEDDDCCPTCLEVYTENNPKTFTRCGHHFHLQCIYEWLERKDTCPMCESKMDFDEDVIIG